MARVAPQGGLVVQMLLAGGVAERMVDRDESVALATLAASGQRIVAAAGIGNPQRFFAMLRGAGLDFMELPLPDHHDFSTSHLRRSTRM